MPENWKTATKQLIIIFFICEKGFDFLRARNTFFLIWRKNEFFFSVDGLAKPAEGFYFGIGRYFNPWPVSTQGWVTAFFLLLIEQFQNPLPD